MKCQEWKRLLWHIPHGVGLPVGLLWKPWIGAAWFVLIIIYQAFEDLRIRDSSYLDIRGYMCGFPLGILLWPCFRFLGEHAGKYLGYP